MKAAPHPLVILVDTREQTPWVFPSSIKIGGRVTPVETRRATLQTGDYQVLGCTSVVERKSVSDFCGTIGGDRARFDAELERMRLIAHAAIIVEGSLEDVYAATAMRPVSILGSVASFLARARVPTLFAGSIWGATTLALGLLKRWAEIESKRASRFRFASHRRRAA